MSATALAVVDAVENSTITSKPIKVKALTKSQKVAKKTVTKRSKPAVALLDKEPNQISSSPSEPVAVKKILTGDKLTEDLIKEHNTLNGSLSRGNGSSFSNSTKMYIVKWCVDSVPTLEKPFESNLIPIESFGEKVLDEPQYLKNKKAKPPKPGKLEAECRTDAKEKLRHDDEAKKSNDKDLKEAVANTKVSRMLCI